MGSKKLTNTSTFPILPSAALVLALYGAVVLFPFIQLKANAIETGNNTNSSTIDFQSRVNTQFPNGILTDKTPPSVDSSEARYGRVSNRSNLSQLHINESRVNSRACPMPDIPRVSTTQASEIKTINAINQWIDCHNQWVVQLQDLAEDKGHVLKVRHAPDNNQVQKRNAQSVVQALIWEDKEKLEYLNTRYAEWKKNSLAYKQRLGFRRNLMSLQEMESR